MGRPQEGLLPQTAEPGPRAWGLCKALNVTMTPRCSENETIWQPCASFESSGEQDRAGPGRRDAAAGGTAWCKESRPEEAAWRFLPLLLWVGQGAGRGSSGCQAPARPPRGRSLGSPGCRGGERRPRELLNTQPLARASATLALWVPRSTVQRSGTLSCSPGPGVDSDSAPAGSRGSLWCRSGCPTDTQMQRRDLTAAGPSANKAGLALVILGSTV